MLTKEKEWEGRGERRRHGARACGVCDAELVWGDILVKKNWEDEFLLNEAESAEPLNELVECESENLVVSVVAGWEIVSMEDMANDEWSVIINPDDAFDDDSDNDWEQIEV